MVSLKLMKLGKAPARIDPRTLRLAKYLTPDLPSPPQTFDLTSKVNVPWGMMLNDTLGDCTCASAGHLILFRTATAKPKVVVPRDSQIKRAYFTITGGQDSGAVELDVLKFWKKHGIAAHKIGGFAALDLQNHTHLMLSVFMDGGNYLGVQLPLTAQEQLAWEVPACGPRGRGKPGSWGGHAVPAVAYDTSGFWVVTWGQLVHVSWAFYDLYFDEGYAVFSNDFLTSQGKTPTGFAKAALLADLSDL